MEKLKILKLAMMDDNTGPRSLIAILNIYFHYLVDDITGYLLRGHVHG